LPRRYIFAALEEMKKSGENGKKNKLLYHENEKSIYRKSIIIGKIGVLIFSVIITKHYSMKYLNPL
jgi:hypothetical protein